MMCCPTGARSHAVVRPGCDCGLYFRPNFISIEGEIKLLEEYGEQLKKEQERVEVRLKDLKGK